MPRFMALATNEQIADAVNASMDGAREALILSLTVMEAVINFLVDIYRSTFFCFLELVVGGGLSLIIGATQEVRLTDLRSVIFAFMFSLDKFTSYKYVQLSAHIYSKRCGIGQFCRSDCHRWYQ